MKFEAIPVVCPIVPLFDEWIQRGIPVTQGVWSVFVVRPRDFTLIFAGDGYEGALVELRELLGLADNISIEHRRIETLAPSPAGLHGVIVHAQAAQSALNRSYKWIPPDGPDFFRARLRVLKYLENHGQQSQV